MAIDENEIVGIVHLRYTYRLHTGTALFEGLDPEEEFFHTFVLPLKVKDLRLLIQNLEYSEVVSYMEDCRLKWAPSKLLEVWVQSFSGDNYTTLIND